MEYFVIFCLGSALFYAARGLPALAAGARDLSRAFLLVGRKRAPLLQANEVREGPVRVRGRVRVLGKPLRAPEPCVAYEEQTGVTGQVELVARSFEVVSGGTAIRVEATRPLLAVPQVRGVLGERKRVVKAGEIVTVYGKAVRVPDLVGPLADYRHESARIVIREATDLPLVIELGGGLGLQNVVAGAGLLVSACVMIALLVVIWF